MFELDPQLKKDTFIIGDFALSRVLLMNDARYPWVILVPRKTRVTEIYQLTPAEQQQFIAESSFVAKQLAELVNADKMNIAALGNVVSQLHIHHVARFYTDESWPAPIWGKGEAVSYTNQERDVMCNQLVASFSAYLTNVD